MKYVVISFLKYSDFVISHIFDTEEKALDFISYSKVFDEEYYQKDEWIYKIVEVNIF